MLKGLIFISDTTNSTRYLHNLLESIFADKPYSICIQDTSGILHSIPELNIDYKFRVHNNPICNIAKQTSKGLNYCSRMKLFSLNKFEKSDAAFLSRCHYGLYEIAKPVFQNGHLACAIYIGNFISGSKADVIKKFKKYSVKTGVSLEELKSTLDKTPEITEEKTSELLNLADSIALFIQLILNNSGIMLSGTNNKNKLNKSTSEGMHWAVAFLMEYVDMHYNREITLKSISKMLFMNADYLSRLFFKETGKNFIDYVNERRIFEARRIITHSSAKLNEISYGIGFKNKSHFNKMFKRFCGMTPLEYKRSVKKDKDHSIKHNPSNVI